MVPSLMVSKLAQLVIGTEILAFAKVGPIAGQFRFHGVAYILQITTSSSIFLGQVLATH